MKTHSAIHAAVSVHSKKKVKPLIKSVIKKTVTKALKEPRKRPNVVQYGLVVRNNINVPVKKKMASQKPKGKTRLQGSPAVHARAATIHRAAKRKTGKHTAMSTSGAVAATVVPTPATTVVDAPGGDTVSKQLNALTLNSPPVDTPSNITTPPGGMAVLPASAVPWPPIPVEKIVDEPEPVTDDDKRIRIASDRQKQLQFVQQRQERTVYLESEINIAAQNGFIIDPAEIQRRRAEITAIGALDPSTKRAASVDATIIGKDPAKPTHYQRNFNILVGMTVILVFVALVTRPSSSSGGTNGNVVTKTNDKTSGSGVGWIPATCAGFLFVWALAVVLRDRKIAAKAAEESGEKEEGALGGLMGNANRLFGSAYNNTLSKLSKPKIQHGPPQ